MCGRVFTCLFIAKRDCTKPKSVESVFLHFGNYGTSIELKDTFHRQPMIGSQPVCLSKILGVPQSIWQPSRFTAIYQLSQNLALVCPLM